MFGVLNNGMRTLVVNAWGEGSWRALCAKAGMPDEKLDTPTTDDDVAHDVFILRDVSGEFSAA